MNENIEWNNGGSFGPKMELKMNERFERNFDEKLATNKNEKMGNVKVNW